jgi:hypothetical protein
MEIKTMRSSYEETDGDRRRAILGTNALTVDLVRTVEAIPQGRQVACPE